MTSTPEGLDLTIEVNSGDLDQRGWIVLGTYEELGEVSARVENDQTRRASKVTEPLKLQGGAASLRVPQSSDHVVLVVDATARPGPDSASFQRVKFGLSQFPVAACGEVLRS